MSRRSGSREERLSQGVSFLQAIKPRAGETTSKEELRPKFHEWKATWKVQNSGTRPNCFSSTLFVLRNRKYLRVFRNGDVHFLEKVNTLVAASETSREAGDQISAVTPGSGRLAVDQYVARPGRGLSRDDGVASTVQQSGASKHKDIAPTNVTWEQRMIQRFKSHRKELEENKNDVTVESSINVGDICVEEASTQLIKFKVLNKHPSVNVTLSRCEFLDEGDGYEVKRVAQIEIPPNHYFEVKVTVKPRDVGRYVSLLVFAFSRATSEFHVVRELCTDCSNSTVQDLQPTAEYKAPPRDAFYENSSNYYPGEPPEPPSSGSLEKEVPLANSSIPPSLRRVLNRGRREWRGISTTDQETLQHINDLLSSGLTMSVYEKRFSTLLHIEEHQMEVDILRYDMKEVTMKMAANKRWLELQVPGLAENRPSVLKGDRLYATNEGKKYEGYVHDVYLESVSLGFNQRLRDNFVNNIKFSVRFTFNRIPLKVQHRAVQLAQIQHLNEILFPEAASIGSRPSMLKDNVNLRLRDRKLESNEQQKEAVCHIVAGTSRPAPYLVFGPPGTGKTVTIVEAIKQVLEHIPSAHVLACAPSNSAADLILQRLSTHVDKRLMVRLNALSRPWSSVPDDVHDFCRYEDGNFYFPSKNELMKHKVIVCTLVTAGRLASARFPAGHFTHVFIDEAGHAVEPEAVIAIAGILDLYANGGGHVILAGDPEQLGPVLRSPVAKQHGLDKSLLERLMKEEGSIYTRNDTGTAYDSRVVTKLLINYRSHPSILKIPNDMFYNGELTAYNDLNVSTLCRWEELPKREFPIIFHGIIGEDCREGNSPSFFNPKEAAQVEKYIVKLLEARGRGINKVKESEIGVITPYRKQVLKIRQVIKKRRWSEIKVGSVEEFQGQERRVIIISTVRSNTDYLPEDKEFKLGFLANPKRFNVAITRAKALLIIIGNPNLLARDPHWKRFIEYCRQGGGYTGCKYVEPDEMMKDIVKRMASLKLQNYECEESMVQKMDDPAWRSEN